MSNMQRYQPRSAAPAAQPSTLNFSLPRPHGTGRGQLFGGQPSDDAEESGIQDPNEEVTENENQGDGATTPPYAWLDGTADDDTTPPLPPHLKEISSLASWTVSSHKPGCGVAALRHPSPSQFWQSDGPQPHTLSIHFFKLVAIAHLRLFIDFSLDESYTPIKMELWAGTGRHDLQMVCELTPKEPRGWIDVDLSGSGGPTALKLNEAVDDGDDAEIYDYLPNDHDSPDEGAQTQEDITARKQARLMARRARRRWRRLGTGPTLRCFLLQLRILENHQNGKDTHLRGMQIFARDESYVFGRNMSTRKDLGDSTLATETLGPFLLPTGTAEQTPSDRVVRNPATFHPVRPSDFGIPEMPQHGSIQSRRQQREFFTRPAVFHGASQPNVEPGSGEPTNVEPQVAHAQEFTEFGTGIRISLEERQRHIKAAAARRGRVAGNRPDWMRELEERLGPQELR